VSSGLRFLLPAAALIVIGAAPAGAEVIRVDIAKLTFVPAEITAHVGDTIEWANADFVAHTATARNKDWDVTIPPGKPARLVVKKAGAVDYYCRSHPNMKGRVEVTGN
jgi:plastocyanin